MEDEPTSAPRPVQADDEWWPELYQCLHEIAGRALDQDSGRTTLQPTLLVNEAYLRLANWQHQNGYNDQAHFLAVASRAIREVLIDHSRRRRSQKRGGGWSRITLSGSVASDKGVTIDLIELDEALRALAGDHPRQAQVVELRFFGGLTIEQAAVELGVSPRTVDLDWRFARAWLDQALNPDDES